MWKLLAALTCLFIAVILAGSVAAVVMTRSGRFIRQRKTPVVCITCHGRGQISVQSRTLDFDGGGFVDQPPRTTICTTCNGTGSVLR